MLIKYETKKLEKLCTNVAAARKKLGSVCADRLMLRLKQIEAAQSIDHLLKLPFGRCHALSADRAGQYAMDLEHPQRLVFRIIECEETEACIIEIVDYH